MKIKHFHIFCLLLSGFVFSFDTCSTVDTEAEKLVSIDQDSVMQGIIKDFSTDYLVDEQLLIFGEKGKEKIRDFFDFLNLYSGSKLEPVLSSKVYDAILKCFADGNASVLLWPVNLPDPVHIPDWLSGLKMTGYTNVKYQITGLKIAEPLHRISPEKYIGLLNGTLTISALSGSDTIHSESGHKNIGIEVIKIRKSFGPDEQEVWQVFLTGVN